MGLLAGSNAQIISTDANGVRTVFLPSQPGITNWGYYSYQVTPITINGLRSLSDHTVILGAVSVPDQMFLPLTLEGTGVVYSGGNSIIYGGNIPLDPMGPYSGDKVAAASTIAGYIAGNSGAQMGSFASSGISETRDSYTGFFAYYYSPPGLWSFTDTVTLNLLDQDSHP